MTFFRVAEKNRRAVCHANSYNDMRLIGNDGIPLDGEEMAVIVIWLVYHQNVAAMDLAGSHQSLLVDAEGTGKETAIPLDICLLVLSVHPQIERVVGGTRNTFMAGGKALNGTRRSWEIYFNILDTANTI